MSKMVDILFRGFGWDYSNDDDGDITRIYNQMHIRHFYWTGQY